MDSRGYGVENDSVTARKVQKAGREKLRRDRLNEQFMQLGSVLDPDRPKNDKATILNDTIQMLKDLTAQVNRLKAEYNSLSEESRELTQEKNELREEKANLKSEIDDLNGQYHRRIRTSFPWATMDPSLVLGHPTFPFSLPVPISSLPVPMPIHPVQPYHFFHRRVPGTISNPFSSWAPYPSPCNPQAEQSSNQRRIEHNIPIKDTRSESSSRQDAKRKLSYHNQRSSGEKNDDFSEVATELELKTPGSSVHSQTESANDQVGTNILLQIVSVVQHATNKVMGSVNFDEMILKEDSNRVFVLQHLSSEERKGKQQPEHKGSDDTTGSISTGCSSSCSEPIQNSSDVRNGLAYED